MKKQGLTKDKHELMLELCKTHTIEEVSDWLNVYPSYIKKHINVDHVQTPVVDVVDEDVDVDPYAHMTDDELNDVSLKELRDYVKSNLVPTLAHTSSRVNVIRAYKEYRGK